MEPDVALEEGSWETASSLSSETLKSKGRNMWGVLGVGLQEAAGKEGYKRTPCFS